MAVGRNVGLLIKHLNKTQKDISTATGVSAAQLNRFVNNKSDLSLENFIVILNELGIDINCIIAQKTNRLNNMDLKLENDDDILIHLFDRLDSLGKEAYLKSLSWASTTACKIPLSKSVNNYLKKRVKI
jgi:transcriptional regulator with XRE-family HTH domain